MKIEEKDNLIAKFMDWQIDNSFPDKDKVWRAPNGNIELDTTMKFSTSWDALMPVVAKIRALLQDNKLYEAGKDLWDFICVALSTAEIKAVNIAVIQFIKWYYDYKN